MLFLFYVLLTLLYAIIIEAVILTGELISIFSNESQLSPWTIVRGITLLGQAAFFIVVLIFFKFHVELVLSNSSTLDNLERARNQNAGPNLYDINPY